MAASNRHSDFDPIGANAKIQSITVPTFDDLYLSSLLYVFSVPKQRRYNAHSTRVDLNAMFCIALVVAAESQDRHCYECTWDATTEISDKERNQKLDKREDLKTSDLPQKWILPQLRYFGKEALTRYPEAADLERLCGKCKLEPNRVCVKWKFYAINKRK
ncbi:hypothetical protein BIW11_03988 [Tropilaelaps mercedesae]|uniref:Uncharacterized protein n=1 Tax=Tropilaelaps mercedesae TaxID=418985 RepID=A0A1V9XD36_9ACAR|nr:hypothetical protein BIW11_03988 [Tropilaelaps mercedesae]